MRLMQGVEKRPSEWVINILEGILPMDQISQY